MEICLITKTVQLSHARPEHDCVSMRRNFKNVNRFPFRFESQRLKVRGTVRKFDRSSDAHAHTGMVPISTPYKHTPRHESLSFIIIIHFLFGNL